LIFFFGLVGWLILVGFLVGKKKRERGNVLVGCLGSGGRHFYIIAQ
jgi:hypothetical protein